MRTRPNHLASGVQQLYHAHEGLKADRGIALAAVTQNGWALEYAHKSLKADHGIVQTAVHNAPYALQFASERLHHDTKCLALFIHGAGPQFLYKSMLPLECRLRAAREVPRIVAWLKDWRAMETVLMAMRSTGVHEGGERRAKRRALGVGWGALRMLDTGDAAIARRVGAFLGTPKCFVGVPGLRVVDVYGHIVATTPKWSEVELESVRAHEE